MEQNMEAGWFLKTGLKNGDIDPSEPPKQIWEAYLLFGQYKLSKFWVVLNKLKSEMGCNVCKESANDLTNNDIDTKAYGGNTPNHGRNSMIECNTADESNWILIHTMFSVDRCLDLGVCDCTNCNAQWNK